MLAVVDTNHLSELERDAQLPMLFEKRRLAAGLEVFTTIITVQEITKGWLALLNRKSTPQEQVRLYQRFHRSYEALRDWDILPFDQEAASELVALTRQRLNIGPMDLKIAAICLAHDATLLTRNLKDFRKVPGLKVENWLA